MKKRCAFIYFLNLSSIYVVVFVFSLIVFYNKEFMMKQYQASVTFQRFDDDILDSLPYIITISTFPYIYIACLLI